MTSGVDRPVDLVRCLTTFGASLTTAHEAVVRLTEEGAATLVLSGSGDRLARALAELGVGVEVIAPHDPQSGGSSEDEPGGRGFGL